MLYVEQIKNVNDKTTFCGPFYWVFFQLKYNIITKAGIKTN